MNLKEKEEINEKVKFHLSEVTKLKEKLARGTVDCDNQIAIQVSTELTYFVLRTYEMSERFDSVFDTKLSQKVRCRALELWELVGSTWDVIAPWLELDEEYQQSKEYKDYLEFGLKMKELFLKEENRN